MLGQRPKVRRSSQRKGPQLASGSRVGVIGGGPAGSFFSYFLLQIAGRVGMDLELDLYEPREFFKVGPGGCNMCGGIVSESLLQHLAAEGVNLPSKVIQRRLDSYVMHMDVGSVRIDTPLKEKRIAAVHRGSGPRGIDEPQGMSFDGFLLSLAKEKGANHLQERISEIVWDDGRPRVKTKSGSEATYDLLVSAVGVNSPSLKLFDGLGLEFSPPRTTKTFISEFFLGRETISRYLGSSMHVFLLDLPRLEFAAIIPKNDFATVVLLGEDIDHALVESFLDSPQVKQCMPPQWRAPGRHCHCSPKINIAGAKKPYADRLVFVGDCGASRLYKDGIGAAYRTAKAAAVTAVFEGISEDSFRYGFRPACKKIDNDNQIGKVVFLVTGLIQKFRFARRGVSRMVMKERNKDGHRRRMSMVLWDTFTGSAPYKSVFLRSLHPAFLGNLIWSLAASNVPKKKKSPKRSMPMQLDITGSLGKRFKDGDAIYRQGDQGSVMYVIQKGQVELVQRHGDKEFCVATLEDGDFFGEMALFGDETRTATARATGDVWALSLQKEALLRRIHEDPSLAFRMMEKMAHRVRDLESALVGLGVQRADLAEMALKSTVEAAKTGDTAS